MNISGEGIGNCCQVNTAEALSSIVSSSLTAAHNEKLDWFLTLEPDDMNYLSTVGDNSSKEFILLWASSEYGVCLQSVKEDFSLEEMINLLTDYLLGTNDTLKSLEWFDSDSGNIYEIEGAHRNGQKINIKEIEASTGQKVTEEMLRDSDKLLKYISMLDDYNQAQVVECIKNNANQEYEQAMMNATPEEAKHKYSNLITPEEYKWRVSNSITVDRPINWEQPTGNRLTNDTMYLCFMTPGHILIDNMYWQMQSARGEYSLDY